MNGIGKRIRAARGSMPRRKLAVLLDCDPHSIYRWERGTCEPRIATLRRIAEALRVSLVSLLADEKDEHDGSH